VRLQQWTPVQRPDVNKLLITRGTSCNRHSSESANSDTSAFSFVKENG
jgi:hypothetical protein